jgi:hypothetical protein
MTKSSSPPLGGTEETKDKRSTGPNVRSPRWEVQGSIIGGTFSSDLLKSEQRKTLVMFQLSAQNMDWNNIQRNHYDWWQFPIDDGSRPEFNLRSEQDILDLRADPIWLVSYRDSVRIVALSWGWDVDSVCESSVGGKWDRKDVRLAKIIRSLWLFQEQDYFLSMQTFANFVNTKMYNNRGFYYGSICLDEILSMTLPRTVAPVSNF